MPILKNVLLLIPNLGLGGAQRVFHDHSMELARHFHVTEAVFNMDGGNMYPSTNEQISLGVEGGGSTANKLQNFWHRVSRLKTLKRRLKTEVCISHLEGADYVNLLSRESEKIILCIHGSKLHDGEIRGPIGWLRKKVLMPALYNRADCIVTVSRDINPELINGFGIKPEKIFTINNFFEVAQIEAKSQEPLSEAEAALFDTIPVVITSGRLAPQKNQFPLLTCFSALLQRQAAKLVFVGDGELRTALTSHARALGMRVYAAWELETSLTNDYDVYFLGLQPNPFKYLSRATIFVLPSAWEGFPMALGEAMICGLPVMSADCPTGPREMLAPVTVTPTAPLRQAERGTYGVLLPMLIQAATLETDQAIWADTMEALITDSNELRKLGIAARERMQDFTRERIAGQWVSLIGKI